ncbi:class I SAM-dependent methyltransferase [Candidatus Gracilibacteria bacterium]|nr:class I SAM-dependent methyltransferase [Candidatus Gracilibacteria bacterium]MCF7898693.1 class I SAM-dependent methyltransferase [Candidatus Paceibacterota bacterium]
MRFERKVELLRVEKYEGEETDKFFNDVILMAGGEPLEYILGEMQFCGTTIDLSLRPNIPKEETEYWVYQAIQDIKDKKYKIYSTDDMSKNIRVLDLFSGSGSIGISFLKKIPNCTLDFIEINSIFKKQIEISLIKNILDLSRVKIIIGDVWSGATGLYDVITAVPPYVSTEGEGGKGVKRLHKSNLNSINSNDEYHYYKLILSNINNYLSNNGVLFLEFDVNQREIIEQIATDNNLSNYFFLTNTYRHDFVFIYIKA